MSPDAPAGPAVIALLIFALLVCSLSSLGLLVMKGFYNKLHYLAPPAVLGTAAVAAAIAVQEGLGSTAVKAGLVLLVMLIANPILTFAAARAKHMANLLAEGKYRPTAEDKEQRPPRGDVSPPPPSNPPSSDERQG